MLVLNEIAKKIFINGLSKKRGRAEIYKNFNTTSLKLI